MRILLTNDDGIGAQGLQTLRRELRQIEGVNLDVIAPDSNRSASARSITTRSPLSVQEINFEDGDLGHATDGTPVDCVRFAQVGLLGEKPDLIVSGINHGLNIGDDVTYSGTVAAALEGILLGLPAIAVSQQSRKGEMGYMPQRDYDFDVVAKFTAGLVSELIENPLPDDTLLNINAPGVDPEGIDITKLGKRLYRDELKKVKREVDDGRTSYRIYGYEPGLDDQPDTDIGAIARGHITVTPLSLDWTHHDEIEGLRDRDFERLLGAASS
ncbi:MAG: 5'/3'-nucleotidase SurE [Solirubrobacterales bacterium]|nr:5'/3'-nucleotidase SurE [Solirubrobacterales bacterium]OJU93867.1 MAG: 5'/3'-nucleotidase SurE [Solirubrobacterales bacterium 67-14]